MAETKQAKSKKSRSKPAAKSASRSSAKSKAKPAKSQAGKGAGSAASNGGQSHHNGVAPIVQKAKLPLLAGGAAVAGVAGAVFAASRTGGKRKVLGVSVPKRSKLSLPKKRNGLKPDAHKVASAVADAAKRADSFGQNVSRIASSVQKVGESADEAVKKG